MLARRRTRWPACGPGRRRRARRCLVVRRRTQRPACAHCRWRMAPAVERRRSGSADAARCGRWPPRCVPLSRSAATSRRGRRRRAKVSPRRSAGAGGDVGAADGAPRDGLDPGHGAGPVEAVRAGQARHHVPRAELLQAHRTLCLRVRLGRRRAPSAGQTAPAEPARSSLPRPRRRRQHLPLQQHAAGCRRCRVVAVVTIAIATAAHAAARCVVVRFGWRGSRAHLMPAPMVSHR